ERADVAKGLFYQYFRDRDDLLHALLVRRLNDLRNVIDAVPVEGTVVDRVGTMIGHHLDYFLRHEDFLLFLHQIRGLIKMKKDEVSGVRETYRDHILFVAEALFPDALKVPAKKKMAEEIACSLLGLLTGFLSHYVIIGSLKNLVVDRERIGQALTQACLGFVREYNGVLATARKGAHSASTGTPAA
ncbi:MAG: TetR/AcrR family transcriptional regulator, partial [Candidatus Binatia bacterium]